MVNTMLYIVHVYLLVYNTVRVFLNQANNMYQSLPFWLAYLSVPLSKQAPWVGYSLNRA